MKRALATLGVTAVAGLSVLAMASPAEATTEKPKCPTWTLRSITSGPGWNDNPADGSGVVDTNSVKITKPEGGGTEFSTKDTGIDLNSNKANITVKYELKDGASFAAGAVRLFYYHDKNANTLTAAPTDYVAAEANSGTLTLSDVTGYIGTVGLVYDASNSAGGNVVFSDLKVGATPLAFEDVCAEPTSPPTTTPPTNEPKKCEAYLYYGSNVTLCDRFANVTGKLGCPDVGYKVKLVNANNDPWGLDGNRGVKGVGCEAYPERKFPTAPASPTLPVTGESNLVKVGAVGAGVLVLGGAAILFARKRRNKFVAE